jgi:two-component system, sensor histidine kinase and response regulator
MPDSEDELREEVKNLKAQLSKQNKVINALKERVKSSIQKSGDAYAIFERNIVLQDLVQRQTGNLQVATKKAEAGSKAKSDFLANMSHEIRTPLNVITGMAHLALKTNLTPQQQNYVNNIQNASRSLLGIINDVLDLSKIEAGKMILENIEFSIETILENLSGVFGVDTKKNNIEVLFSIDHEIPKTLIGDPLRLGQVLNNLCSNAIKFTHEGQIILGIEVEALKSESVKIKFSVKDSGVGIKKEQSEKLFKAFSQADDSVTRKYGGTGLGLSICKHLVSMMDGEIWLESEENVGSIFLFTMTFPIKENQAKINYELPKELSNKNILIVDDNPSSTNIILNILTTFGLNAKLAFSGDEAIEKVSQQESDASYDIIFVDYKMPWLNGIDTIKKISQVCNGNDRPVFVLMMAANDVDEAKETTEMLSVEKLLIKPFLPSTFINVITDIFLSNENENAHSSYPNIQSLNNNIKFIKPLSILVVDDNKLNIEVVSEIIKDLELSVSSVTNGFDAIKMVKRNEFDLVLMDIQMPEMDGLETTRRIRADVQCKDIPILAMTAHAMEYDVRRSIEAGMDDHLTKPIDPLYLKEVLARILTGIHGMDILRE